MLKKINYWTIGFFERHLLEPLIKMMIIGFIIFLLMIINGCNQKQESFIISKFQECEFRMINQSYINYTCPQGSGALGINRETGELDICNTNKREIDGTIYLDACLAKEGFDSCYQEYQKEELAEFCKDVLCYPNECINLTDW